jgi:6-pyruvoyl tetrahydropterin synthase/QueD family protein
MRASKTIEFDAGHRVARHGSKCANPHGHRYAVTLNVDGLVRSDDSEEDGMVTDFGRLKTFLTLNVHDRFDHGFIVAYDDAPMLAALTIGPPWKVIILGGTPTAENLAEEIGRGALAYFAAGAFAVHSVVVHETPSCSATWFA